jgi:hypothetical protein
MRSYCYRTILPSNQPYVYQEESLNFLLNREYDVENFTFELLSVPTTIFSRTTSDTPVMLSFLELSTELGFEYAPFLQFESSNQLRQLPLNSTCLPEQFCNDEVLLQKVRNGDIYSSISVKHIGLVNENGMDVGYGLFATNFIEKETYLGEYTGLVSQSRINCQKSGYCLLYPTDDGGTYFDALHIGNIIRFINHSVTPNAEFRTYFFDGAFHILCVSHPNYQLYLFFLLIIL